MKWNIENWVEKISDESQYLSRKLQQSFIAEILLGEMNLFYRLWHVMQELANQENARVLDD